MEDVLYFIEQNQVWIYLILGVLALIYGRAAIRRLRELRRAFFGLERERARERLTRVLVMLGLIVAAALSTYAAAALGAPALPLETRRTEVPTVSLLSTVDEGAAVAEDLETATPMGEAGLEGTGCANVDATIRVPEQGGSISGVVEVRGAASIPGFAFYKLEYRGVGPGEPWRAVSAGTQPVCERGCPVESLLGKWDTGLVTPGEYFLRLVVTDTVGNAPLPCVVRVRVLPSG